MARKASGTPVRQEQILRYLGAHGEAAVETLATRFKVSPITIRRDLAALEKAARVTRTHGGAILSQPRFAEFLFVERAEQYLNEKRAIAGAIAEMLRPGNTVALDNGTTTFEVAKAIAGIDRLTVLTSSLAIASVLYTHETINTVLLGGSARVGSPDLVGWLTEENLKRFHVDFSIVGADGVTREGVYASAVDLARSCRAIMDAGSFSVLAVDHSKIGRPSFAQYAALHEFSLIITDAGVPASRRRWLRQAATRVMFVRASDILDHGNQQTRGAWRR